MKRFFASMVLAGIVGVMAMSEATAVWAAEKDDEAIGDIMQKLHNKKKGIHPGLGKSLKGDPNWAEIEKSSKEYLKLNEELEKTTVSMGSKESWTRLTKLYTAEAKVLVEGATKKDVVLTNKGFTGLMKSCQECHDAHR